MVASRCILLLHITVLLANGNYAFDISLPSADGLDALSKLTDSITSSSTTTESSNEATNQVDTTSVTENDQYENGCGSSTKNTTEATKNWFGGLENIINGPTSMLDKAMEAFTKATTVAKQSIDNIKNKIGQVSPITRQAIASAVSMAKATVDKAEKSAAADFASPIKAALHSLDGTMKLSLGNASAALSKIDKCLTEASLPQQPIEAITSCVTERVTELKNVVENAVNVVNESSNYIHGLPKEVLACLHNVSTNFLTQSSQAIECFTRLGIQSGVKAVKIGGQFVKTGAAAAKLILNVETKLKLCIITKVVGLTADFAKAGLKLGVCATGASE